MQHSEFKNIASYNKFFDIFIFIIIKEVILVFLCKKKQIAFNGI